MDGAYLLPAAAGVGGWRGVWSGSIDWRGVYIKESSKDSSEERGGGGNEEGFTAGGDGKPGRQRFAEERRREDARPGKEEEGILGGPHLAVSLAGDHVCKHEHTTSTCAMVGVGVSWAGDREWSLEP